MAKKKKKKIRNQLVYKKKLRKKKRRQQRQRKIDLRNIAFKSIRDDNKVLPVSSKTFKKIKQLNTLRELAETKARLSEIEKEVEKLRKENEKLKTKLNRRKTLLDHYKQIRKEQQGTKPLKYSGRVITMEELEKELIEKGKFETEASPVPLRLAEYEDVINMVDKVEQVIRWITTDPTAREQQENALIELGVPDAQIDEIFEENDAIRPSKV